MLIRRSDRSRKAREKKHSRSSVFFRSTSLWAELAPADRDRRMHFEPLEDRSMLAVLVVDPSNPGAFSTINLAMAAANGGDTINVVAGTFSENVNVNKSVTIEGAQHGVDARGRVAAETIVTGVGNSGKTPFYITASDVTIDGFTIEGATDSNQFGFGVLIGGGTSGAHILNNIIDDNIVGLSLANANPADPAVIQHNVFANNNQPGPASGTGIYMDQSTAGGTLSGALIDGNDFTGHADAGIDFSTTDATKPATGITISNNDFDGNARGVVAFNLTSSSITSNTFQNSTSNATADIRLFEGVDGLSITNNLMQDGAGKVLRVSNIGTGSPDATNITFNGNSVSGYTGPASLFQIDNYTGTLDARFNWWGTNNDVAINGLISNPAIVGFSPYLDNGSNSAVGTGFIGDFAHLDVTPLGFQFGAAGPIEAAILAAAPGATVTVNAGTYIEDDVVITQGIQLIANGAVTIQAPTAGSGTGVTINAGAANVTLQGFTLTGFATGISATSAGSLLLKDDTLSGNTAGGSISGVTNFIVTSTSGAGQSAMLNGGAPSSTLQIAGQDSLSYTGLTTLALNAGSGANDLTVDFAGGNPIPAGGLTYNGGGIGSLTVSGYSGVQVTDTYTSTGPGHSGNVQIGAGGLISYAGLAPLTLSGTASDLIIDLSQTGVANNVVVADDGSAADPDATNNANTSAIYSTTNAFEYTQFTNPTNSLTVNTGSNGDTVTLTALDSTFAATAVNLNGSAAAEVFNIEATPASATTTVSAANGLDTINVSSDGAALTGNLDGIDGQLNVDAGATGGDVLNISESGSATADNVTVTATSYAGTSGGGWSIQEINFGFSGGVNLSLGSAGNTVQLLSTFSGQPLTINTGAGNDTFNVSGPLSGAVSILAGSQATDDVLNYDAGGQDVVLSANSITAGAGQTLTFSNIEDVNITNVAGVTVNGDGNANSLTLVRTGAATNAYTLDGGPTVTFAGATSFAFNGLGNDDSLSVDNSNGLIDIPISFAGGSGFDSLFVSGDAGPNVSAVYSQTGPDATGFAGSIVYTGAVTESINFTGLSPVETLTPLVSLTINDAPGATAENIVTGPTSTGIDPFLGTTATTYQVNYGGAGEPINWRNATTVTVNGSVVSDAITENLPTQVDAGSPNQLTTLNVNAGSSADEIDILATPAGVVTNANTQTGTPDRVVIGGTFANFNNGTGSTAAILGAVNVTDAGGVGQLYVDDSAGAGPDVVTLTNASIVGAAPAAIGYDATMTAVQIALTSQADTVDVQSTQSGAAVGNATVTTLFGNDGGDTFNVSSTAPAANGNGTLTGDLNGIQGELDIASGAGDDALNVSDYGGVGRNYTVASPGAGVTLIGATGVASIVYNFSGGFELEHFNLVGASAGGNAYNILGTTAALSNIVSDGDTSASGASTFAIQADQLQAGASNAFNGFAGDDLFDLNFAAGASVPSAPGTTLAIDGGGLATGNDRVNVNANQAGDGFRDVQINYGAGNAVALGGLGTDSVIQVNGTRQVNYYGDAAGDDELLITTPATGAHTLSVTPVSANSADVFLDGTPLLAGTATATNNPGVAGGGAGPDLFVDGLDPFLFEVDGGSSGPGIVNKLIVNAPTEDLNGASTTSAWGGNAFGSLPSIQPAGSAFNDINVDDSLIDIFNNGLGELLNVNIGPGGFVPAGVFPAPATVIVNSGDQTGTCGCGIADAIFVLLSPVVHFQVNGGTPPTSDAPDGDQLTVDTPNDIQIWSDGATPPNVSIGSSGLLPVTYASIERLELLSGNGIANVYGDNNDPNAQQDDGYRVVGTGPNSFNLQISGDKNDPASYSAPISVNGVTTLNLFGGDNSGGAGHDPETTNTGIDALDITPFADNTPQGWGVQTFWNEGDPVTDGDLLIYNGVAGVSESINVQPSGSQAGQVYVTNSATGTPIAVINYVLNTDIVVNGNDGSAGDTDTLTLFGTDPANPGSSGQDHFAANFAAAGTPADPMVIVSDVVGGAALYTLDNFTNINTLNVKMLGGSDLFHLISGRNDGSLTVNVDGGAPSGPGNADAVEVDGAAGSDAFSVSPGASSDAGRIAAQLAGATAPTVLNFTTTENVAIAGGGGADSVSLDGTGSNDSFALANGTAQVNSGAPVLLSGFGPGSSLNLNGLGGANSFAIDQATGGLFANVNVNGGPAGGGSATLTGTPLDDSFDFTPTSPTAALVGVGGTTYSLSGLSSLAIDGAAGSNNTLSVAPTNAVVTPGSTSDSGTVAAVDAGGNALLPLSYSHIDSATVTGGTLVIDSSDDNTSVTVAANGDVTVVNNQFGTNVYHAAGYNALVINLSGDNSQVNIAASANFAGGIQVFGDNDGAGNTTLTYTGDNAAAVNFNIDTRTIAEIGMSPVTFTSVSTANINAGVAQPLTLSGATGSENVAITPTSLSNFQVQAQGLPTAVNITAFLMNLAFAGTNNQVSVNAFAPGRSIGANAGQIAIAGTSLIQYAAAQFRAIWINGVGGNNTLTINSAPGAIPVPIHFNGGSGSGNTLVLQGGVATSDIYSPGPNPGEGTSTIVIGGVTQSVYFVNLAPVIDNVAGPLTVNGTNGDDAITAGATPNVVSVNNLETIAFANKTSLTLNGLAGSDSFAITPSTLALAGGPINIVGGGLGEGDSLSVTGLAGTSDSLAVIPVAAGAGVVADVDIGTLATLSTVNYTGIAGIQLVGQASDGDTAAVTGTAGDDTLAYTPGADATSGSFSGTLNSGAFALPNVSFTQMSSTTGISLFAPLAGVGGNDTVVFNGTTADDTFDVNSPAGPFAIFGPAVLLANSSLQQALFTGTAQNLALAGGAGNDTYNVPALKNAVPVNVAVSVQGNPAENDVLNFTADGTGAVTVDLAAQTVTEAGFAPVSFAGVATVNINANGQDVSVLGTAGNDDLSYTPSGTDAGTLALNGLNAAFNLSSVGNLSIDLAGGVNSVTVSGTANADTITVLPSGANTTVQVGALQAVALVSADTQGLIVNGGLGNDVLSVNATGSTNPVAIPITYDGGADINALTLRGTATSDAYTPGPQPGSGSSAIVYAGGAQVVNFVNLAPIFDFVAGPLVVNGTNAANAINYSVGFNNLANFLSNTPVATWGQVSIDGYEPIEFINKTTLTINGLAGDDAINLNNPNTPTGLTAINVNGGDPAASDTLVVNGTAGADAINYTPASANSGTVAGLGPVVNVSSVEHLVVNGQGGNDALTVTTPNGGAEIGYLPGATRDAGSVSLYGFFAASALLPVDFSGLGSFGSVTFINAGGGRPDGLDIHGTSSDDRFDVSSAGTVHVVKPTFGVGVTLPINTPGVAFLRLVGEAGDDVFNIPGNTPFPNGINVQGGDPSASDVLNFTGTGAGAVTVDLTAQTITEAGFAPVSFTGVEHVNVNANGQAVTVNDNSGPNTLEVTPTGANSALLQVQGANSVFNLTNAASLALGFTPANNNQLVVNATPGADTINVSGASVSIVGLLAVNETGVASLTVNGLEGSDTFNVTAAAIPIHVNGGDPIGVLPGDTLNILAGGDPVQYFAGPHVDEGGFVIGANAEISFQEIESIGAIINPGPVLIVGTNGSDDIQVIARDASYITSGPVPPGLNGTRDFTVSVNQGPNLLFVDASQGLFIDALSGDDQVDVRAPAPNNAPWNMQVVIAGGAPAGQPGLNGDDFTFETPGAGNHVVYQPKGVDTGIFALTQTAGGADSTLIALKSFTIPAPPLASPYVSSDGGFESAAYDGQGANDVLDILAKGGNDTITSTPGAADDAGTIAVNSLLALSYKNLGAGGSLAVAGNGGVDTLVVNGTAAADNFAVDPVTGAVHVNGRTAIERADITNLVLNGLASDNVYSVSALQPYANITVNGSGNSDPDVLNLVGDGSSAVTVNLVGPTQTVSGGGLGVVDITGVAIVNLSNAAGDITVLGSSGPDSLSVTPTGLNSATIQAGQQAPVLNTSNTGALVISDSAAGDGDSVVVHGTAGVDTINIVQGATTTVQVGGWKQLSIDGTNVEALVVDGGLGADVFNVSGGGGAALTVSGGQTPAVDALNLATTSAVVSYGTDPSSGVIGTLSGPINFAGLVSITLVGNGTGPLTVNGTTGDDSFNQLANQVAVNNGAVVNFSGYASLTLNGLAGVDHFNVNPTTLPGGLTFNVNGGPSTSGDSLTVNGSAAQESIDFLPSGANAGSVAVGLSPAVNFSAIGSVSIDGQGGNDLLTTTTPAGADAITYTAGSTVDAASIQVGSLVPMSFTNLGASGTVTLADASGNPVDTLLYNGTAGNDAFGVNATGIVFLNNQLQVNIPGIASLTLDGQGGVNSFSVAANIAIPVNINGGGDAAGNTLAIFGDGAADVTLDLEARTVQETGFGLIGFNGVGQVTIDAAGNALLINGTAGDDRLTYTPTGAQSGQVTQDGSSAVFDFANVLGAFTIDPLGGNDAIAVNGTSSNDMIGIVRGATTTVSVGALKTVNLPLGSADALTVNGVAGVDVFNVSGGNLGGPALTVVGGQTPAAGILNVVNSAAAGPATTVTPGATPDAGTIANADGVINFQGIRAGALTGFAANDSLSVLGTNDADTIALQFLGGANRFWVNSQAVFSFSSFGTVNLRGNFGDDQFSISPVGLVGVTTINAIGGDPTASDQLIVNGSAAADIIGFNPTAADGGSVTIAGSPTVIFNTTESVVINGQGGNDSLGVTTPLGADSIVYTPGATSDSASVQVGSLAPMQFKNLGAAGSVSLADASLGRVDTLVYGGSAANDTFTVAAGGVVTLNSQLAVSTPGISNLVLNGLNGDDTFNVAAPQPFASISLAGGDPSASDVVNLTGDGSAISLDLGGATTTVTGGGLGIVILTSDETLNLNAAGGAVTATDSTGPNTLDVTPTDVAAATLQVEGQSPVVNLTNSGAFNVNFTGAGDSLVVNGTTGPDTINASGAVVAVNALLAVNYAGATSLVVNGSTGADTFNVAPAALPIHVNGGDPIGVLPGDTLNVIAGGDPVSFFPGPHSDEGGFQVGANAPLSYQEIESIGAIVGPGPVLIVGTNGSDDIQVIARDASYNALADGVQDYTVSVNQGPDILFIDAPQLFIDALSGDDQVGVRAPAPNAAVWNTQVTIAGGAPAGQPGLNGDDFTLETPGANNNVTYQPTNIDGGVFTFSSSTITLTSAPFTIPAINYTSSAGGFESAAFDGQGGNATLTIVGTAGADTITHSAGAANDAGAFAVNSLLALSYKNLGAAGSATVNGNGGADTLAVNGTANNDAFTVDATTGTVHMNNRVAIAQTGISNLVINGYNPNNTFNLNASLPYLSTTVNSIDPATLNLLGTPGAEAIGVDPANSQITGFGGVVNYVGVAIVNMNGNGGADSLTVTGTTDDDVFAYKPTSSSGGTFSQGGVPVAFNFNIGAGNTFTINGGGGNGGDEVDVQGNNAGSVITVDSPNRTVSVENALNIVLMPVVLGADIQVAGVTGGLGNNTFLVIPARNVPAGNDIVGPGFLMPNNLLVHVNGGAVPANAALVVAGANGATLNNNLFAVVNRTSNTSGVVRMFESTGGPAPIQYPDISYSNVGIVQASTAINAATHQQQTLTMGPDLSAPNGSLNNAAFLGSGASINATNLTIFPNAFEHRFVQAEQDWFRVVAQFTGTMDFQVYFNQYAGFLPGGGELQIQVYDAAGNLITNFGVNDTDSDQRRRIPVVAGETYYLQVYGITQDPLFTPADGFDPTNATVNAYSLAITNTPAPKPDSLGLNNIVAQGSINNAIAPTATSFTASNAAVPPPPTQPLPPLSSIDGFYVGKLLEFTSGALVGQRQLVTAYVGATHTFTFASGFSAAPAIGDKFQIESNDTGRSQLDDVTRDNTPTIYIRLDAANTPTDGLIDLQGGGSTSQNPPNNTPILIPFWSGDAVTPPNSPANNGSFRVAVYDNTNPQSPIFLGYAIAVPGQQGVFQLQVTTPLAEGTHILAAKVEIDSPSTPSNKDLSAAATTQIVVDTLAPPVFFGSPTVPNSGLLGSSDTGVNGQPATIVDRITADSTPTLYGAAEANAVVRLYSDTNNNGIVDNGDVFLGLTTATPVDGTNQFPSGQWQITSNIDLNNPNRGFPLDGVRHLLVTAEDVSGNVSAPQALTIFLDTQGPVVKNVSVTGSPGFDLFAVKANTVNPTPLVNSLDITFNDLPIRVGPNFVYPAVNPILASTPGNYLLVGQATGPVVITSITFSDSTASGTPGKSVATLHFAAPLPDDRYTLTMSDNITDNAGNNLDGEFGPTFSSGNGKIGGQFLGQFTVDSRPEVATYSSGSVSVDLNGNFIFDPQNVDKTNRDTTFAMGFSTDRLFAGKLADSHGVVNGFDKLGAYGFLNGQWRWLLDLDGDGVINPAAGDLSIVEPLALDALPVAGNWTNNPALGDQIGLFDGKTWWLDLNNDHVINNIDVALGGKLTGNMQGLPIVGDFDGDGKTDLGAFANGVFSFDLSSKDFGGKLTGNTNTILNVQTDLPNNIGFAGVLSRPVAADMDHDGITDIGLFVPGRTQNNAPGTAEWYWLISNDPNGTKRIAGQVNTQNHPFDPTPLGHDLFSQFGSQFALPVVGNFDPPANGGAGSGGTQSGGGNWIQNLYLDVLGRAASNDEVAYWTDQVNHGVTGAQIATLFLTSTEHRSQLINTLYQQYLGRQADQAGINYWISVWNATGGPEAVQAGIIGSIEYYNTAGGTDAAWVTALYQNVLGRTVDAQGLAYWTDYIKTHSKQSVVLGFVTSDEYRLGLINGWFQVFLGRTLDASGAQYWLLQMKLGMTQEQIQAGILGSVEFKNR